MVKYIRDAEAIERRDHAPRLLMTPRESTTYLSTVRPYDYYVYILHREDGTPFYIGKGVTSPSYKRSARPAQHFESKKTHKSLYAFIQKRRREQMWVSIHCFSADENLVLLEEAALIEKYGRRLDGGILFNLSAYGGGQTSIPKSAETKRKLSIAHTGKIVSRATRLKIGFMSRGRRHGEYTKMKLRAIAANRAPISDETRKRLSESRKSPAAIRQLQAKWIAVEVEGETFPSYAEASRQLGIRQTTLYYRVKSGMSGYKEVNNG